MLIFVLQTIWLYIKELAGKDLDIEVIFKFLFYFTPKLIPLVLPLTILLASIMVFGSFAENYEFAAMKSTGISLQRAMSGLSVFIVILGITTFFFSNNVIPWAELKSYNLRRNIAKLKPAMVLAEGQFNPISTYNIKFDKKHGEKDQHQYLDNVVIHKKGNDGRKNATVIKSKTGELISSENSNIIKLILNDGNYYEDIYSKDPKERNKKPFAKSSFKTYTMNIDISQMNDVDMNEESQTDKHSMLDVVDLNKAIDSLEIKRKEDHETFSKSIFQRTSIMANNHRISKVKERDSVSLGSLLDSLELKRQVELVDMAQKTMASAKQLIISRETPIKAADSIINRHYISLHEKFALGLACIVLFFVGAPLGALIRKGGIGLPMVVAILLFLTYHFIGIFATNSAKNGGFNPILASWFSTLIMLPLGVFLTKRATADKGLFEFDNLIEPIKRALNIKDKETVDYTFMHSYKNDRILDVIANYDALGHDENTRYEALKLLNFRGYSTRSLRSQGLQIDEAYDTSEDIYTDYKDHTKFAITLYIIGAVLLILHFVFANNKLPSVATASIQISLVSFAMYIIYYFKSIININQFYKHINKIEKKPHPVLIAIGLPLYFIGYIFLNSKMKEDLKQNCLNSLK